MQLNHYGIIEAEDFDLVNGFEIVHSNWMWGDYVKMPTKGQASMHTVVNNVPGVYDIVVYYWDTTIGSGQTSVIVDGKTLSNWNWNQNLGSSLADIKTYTARVIPNVAIKDGSEIVITGSRSDAEPLFIDKILLEPPANRTAGMAADAFQGAEGFGSDTVGGRGGWIVKVTNLNDSGEGSLRWALEDFERPRIVVFDVGGVITLKDNLLVRGDVTVAGQTAPGDGITIRGAPLQIVEDNVIIRGLKFRPGDGPGSLFETRDAISIGSAHTTVDHVVIDSNSFSWATDEVVNVWFGARDITISNNIIAEGIDIDAAGDKFHSLGFLVGDGASNITIANNLIMSSEFRNPTIADATNVELVNNLVYNYGQHALSFTIRDWLYTKAHVIGNYFERGPSSGTQKAVRLLGGSNDAAIWLSDNISHDRPNDSYAEAAVATGAIATVRGGPVFTSSGVTAMAATDVRDYVLAHAGARAQGLDKTDARLIGEVKNGGGNLKTATPSGAYAIASSTSTLPDRDGDGIPDVFEASVGGNPNIFDPHNDSDGDGYSNIEDYVNSLLPQPSDGGVSEPPVRVEAEAFDLIRGFTLENRPITSAGQVIVSYGWGEAVARLVFGGPDGVYDLGVGYADESDGAARMQVWVNDIEVHEWIWNRSPGGSDLNAGNLVEHAARGVTLQTGDTIELRGLRDGGEPVRTDYIDFTFVDQLIG